VSFDDLPTPAFTGVRVVEPDLAELREMIDWQFFFLAWELKGKYPAILDQPVGPRAVRRRERAARQDHRRAGRSGPWRYGFWPRTSEATTSSRRGRAPVPDAAPADAKPAGAPTAAWPTTSPRATTSAGSRSTIHGAESCAAVRGGHDDYRRSW
jgi:5-methyltetrahydrofolate--homocysteine methyltransferase